MTKPQLPSTPRIRALALAKPVLSLKKLINRTQRILLLTAALFIAGTAQAQYVHTDGTRILDENGNPIFFSGINLGNWLVWEGYLMMGDFNYRTHTQFFNSLSSAFGSSDRAAEFEYQWRLNYVDERAIADLKALGFNSVRVPFNYNLFWWDGQLRDNGFEFFDRVIEWCRTHNMYVLLDMHGAPGYQNPGDHSDNMNSDASQPRDSVGFWDGNNVQIAATIWRHIANRYKNEPVVWGYDLINEPVLQAGREYELLPSYITMRNAIREVDNNHIIVAEGGWWGSDLSVIDWSNGTTQSQTGVTQKWDHNLVYQIHHYGPAADTMGRENITNSLNIPLIIGEYGESDNGNLLTITDWAKANLAGYFPWSFKKMSHDRTLWTIPTNSDYEAVKNFINNGGTPPTHLYDAMIAFAQNNVRNGHGSHVWHQGFYDAVKPDPASTTPPSGCGSAAATNVPGRVQAEAFCAQNGIQTEPTSDAGGGENIGWIESGDWADYAIQVGTAGNFNIDLRVASLNGGGRVDIVVNGSTLGGVDVAATGGWQSWQTLTVPVSLPAGKQTLRLNFTSGGLNVNWFEVANGSNNTSGPLAAGTYAIINMASGRSLDVSGVSTANGANVHQWDYVGGLNQQWILQWVNSTHFQLVSVNSGACLDADSGSDNVHQWSCSGGNTNQHWQAEALGGGSYRVFTSNGAEVLEAANGATTNGSNVRTATNTSSVHQTWRFDPL